MRLSLRPKGVELQNHPKEKVYQDVLESKGLEGKQKDQPDRAKDADVKHASNVLLESVQPVIAGLRGSGICLPHRRKRVCR